MVFFSTGTKNDNWALGLKYTVLTDERGLFASKFGSTGTPSAIMSDRDGKIASRLTVGAANVRALLASYSASEEEAA